MGPPDAFAHYRLLLVDKWRDRLEPACLRAAHGYALCEIGFRYLSCGYEDQGWDYIEQALRRSPEVFGELDTLYELALGERPRGERSQPAPIDGTLTITRFIKAGQRAALSRNDSRLGLSNLYLAYAMLNDQAHDWVHARRYLYKAIRRNPYLLLSPSIGRRLIKLHTSPQIAQWAKSCGGKLLERLSAPTGG
jgi:hypothetical protein